MKGYKETLTLMDNKPKLDINHQIQDLKDKNVQFNIVTEDQAKKFLSVNTYYYKLKSYLRVFDKYSSGENKGKYYNVDFAYIKELSSMDMSFRRIVMGITLDIEHMLKSSLIYDISMNYEENGYDIVKEFFERYEFVIDKIKDKAQNSACEKLIEKNIDHFSAWNLVEVLSFGDFINFYTLYYKKYDYVYDVRKKLINCLKPIKFLRNAAAHNNCLFNTLRDNKYEGFTLNNEVSTVIANLGVCSNNVRNKKMGNRAVHDFVVTFYVFCKLTENKELAHLREQTITELKSLFEERFTRHADYFKGNALLKSNYDFVKNVVDKMAQM